MYNRKMFVSRADSGDRRLGRDKKKPESFSFYVKLDKKHGSRRAGYRNVNHRYEFLGISVCDKVRCSRSICNVTSESKIIDAMVGNAHLLRRIMQSAEYIPRQFLNEKVLLSPNG